MRGVFIGRVISLTIIQSRIGRLDGRRLKFGHLTVNVYKFSVLQNMIDISCFSLEKFD